MTPLAAYLLLFVAVGIGFIFVHLMAGKIIRPNKPDPGKRTIYECGEPTIGSAWIQFDLRFYVVALLFVIFDVEVAFFFPWAVVFGKANALAAVGPVNSVEAYHQTGDRAWELMPIANRSLNASQHAHMVETTSADLEKLNNLRAERQRVGNNMSAEDKKDLTDLELREHFVEQTHEQARLLSWMALGEIVVFFGVLLVGFAYLWHRGDLAWVRSLAAERSVADAPATTPVAEPIK
jgi:NADH-quinone oxidoreductase subunit A